MCSSDLIRLEEVEEVLGHREAKARRGAVDHAVGGVVEVLPEQEEQEDGALRGFLGDGGDERRRELGADLDALTRKRTDDENEPKTPSTTPAVAPYANVLPTSQSGSGS